MKTDRAADLMSLLDIPHGVTAIIGGGGKTTLMEYLADRLPGTVLLCTTTHIRRPARFPILTDADPDKIRAALGQFRAVCVGTAAEKTARVTEGKAAQATEGKTARVTEGKTARAAEGKTAWEMEDKTARAAEGKTAQEMEEKTARVTEGKTARETAESREKLTAPRLPFPVLTGLADYVLTEADGSRGLPLKAHAPWEPVIPESAARVILVVGLDGIGKPLREACHRSELYAKLADITKHTSVIPEIANVSKDTSAATELEDVTKDAIVTPELAARVIAAEGYGDRVFLNKAEHAQAVRYAEELAACLAELRPVPVICGSLWNGTFRRLC